MWTWTSGAAKRASTDRAALTGTAVLVRRPKTVATSSSRAKAANYTSLILCNTLPFQGLDAFGEAAGSGGVDDGVLGVAGAEADLLTGVGAIGKANVKAIPAKGARGTEGVGLREVMKPLEGMNAAQGGSVAWRRRVHR